MRNIPRRAGGESDSGRLLLLDHPGRVPMEGFGAAAADGEPLYCHDQSATGLSPRWRANDDGIAFLEQGPILGDECGAPVDHDIRYRDDSHRFAGMDLQPWQCGLDGHRYFYIIQSGKHRFGGGDDEYQGAC